jgi:DNA-binding transcriptional LysR family regulator
VANELSETTERPSGTLRVTTTVGLGSGWLTYRVQEFLELFPEMNIQMVLSNEELDLNMREADCAIRLRQPQQPDIIQRRLFTVHMHVYASPDYIAQRGEPKTLAELDQHSLITFGEPAPDYLTNLNSLLMLGRPDRTARTPRLEINSIMAIKRALQRGAGLAMLPDYAIGEDVGLVRVLEDIELPSFDTYFAYAESMRNTAKLQAFRDFLVTKARSWKF